MKDTTAAQRPEAIRIENLHKSFGALEVLKGVSLRACEGDVVAITPDLKHNVFHLEAPSATLDKTVEQLTRIARNTAATIELGRDLRDDEIVVVPGYEGPAYGVPDQQTVDAIHLAARTEGMLTDPVYEGKSMAGMIGMIRSGEIPAGSKVLYCHLGGQPALSAYAGYPGLGS